MPGFGADHLVLGNQLTKAHLFNIELKPHKNASYSQVWWCTSLIPALRRQRQVDSWVRGQTGLLSEFQDTQGYTEKPHLQKNPPPKKNPKPKTNKQTKTKNKKDCFQYKSSSQPICSVDLVSTTKACWTVPLLPWG